MLAAGGGAKAVQMLSPTFTELPVSNLTDVCEVCQDVSQFGQNRELPKDESMERCHSGQVHPLTKDQNTLSSKLQHSISFTTFSKSGTILVPACNCKTCRSQDWRCDEEFELDASQRLSRQRLSESNLQKLVSGSGGPARKPSLARSPTSKRMSDSRQSLLDYNLTIGGDFNQQLLENAQWQAPPPRDILFRNASEGALRAQRPSQKLLRLKQARENLRYKVSDSRCRKRQMELEFVAKARSRLEERHSAAEVRRQHIDEMRAEVRSSQTIRLKVAKQHFLEDQARRWFEILVVVMALNSSSRGAILWRLRKLDQFGSVFANHLLQVDERESKKGGLLMEKTYRNVDEQSVAKEIGVTTVAMRPSIEADPSLVMSAVGPPEASTRQSKTTVTVKPDANPEVLSTEASKPSASQRKATNRLTVESEGNTLSADGELPSSKRPSASDDTAIPSSPLPMGHSRKHSFRNVSREVWTAIHRRGNDDEQILDASKEDHRSEINQRRMVIYALQKKTVGGSAAQAHFMGLWQNVRQDDDQTQWNLSPDGRRFRDVNELLRVAIRHSEVTWTLWKLPLSITMFIARLRYRPKRNEHAGNILRKFLMAATSQNAMLRAIRRFTWSVRLVQGKIRAYLELQRLQKMDVAETWMLCEENELKRIWASADRKTLQSERDRLMGIRSAKEKEHVERIIALTRENMKRYLHPKTEGDFVILRTMLDRHLLPSGLRAVTIAQIFHRKRSLYKKSLFCYDLDVEAYKRAITTWKDIDQAIKMLDPLSHNPAPKPRAPLQPRLNKTVDKECLRRIVIRVMRWHEDNREALEDFLTKRQTLTPDQRWRQAFAIISGKSQDLHSSVIQPIIDVVNEEVDPENLIVKRNAQISVTLDRNVISLATKMHEDSQQKRLRTRPSSAPPGNRAEKPPPNSGTQQEVKSTAPSTSSASRPTSAPQRKAVTAKAKGTGLTRKRGSLI